MWERLNRLGAIRGEIPKSRSHLGGRKDPRRPQGMEDWGEGEQEYNSSHVD